jgi:predicted PurR-regulated permease PerM
MLKTIPFQKTSLVFIFIISCFLIYNKWLPLVGATLFSLLILDFSYSYSQSKKIALFFTFLFLSFFIYGLFQFGSYISNNFDSLFNININELVPIFHWLKIPVPIDMDFNYILKLVLGYIKGHLNIVTTIGNNSLQMIIGIIFGVLFFTYDRDNYQVENNYWSLLIETISSYLNVFFQSFKTIMSLQIIVALLNTLSLAILSLVIAKIVSGDFMPYWYILLPLAAIFSLIPVIGNILINILIFVIAINVSLIFSIVAIVYFFLVHKLELVAIAKLLGKKASLPFLFVALSMLIGELIFNSMLGVLFGITVLLTIKTILSSYSNQLLLSEHINS